MSTKSICVCTIVGLFASVVVSSCLHDQIQGFLKREKQGLFEGDICEWDGVNCAKFAVVVSSLTLGEKAVSHSNTADDEATATSSSSSSSDEQVQNSSLQKDCDDINGWDKPLVHHQQYQHPPGVVGLGTRDEIIRLTTKLLHFFIAKIAQYKYQPPMHPGPSTTSLAFWLAFAPSVTLS